MNVILGVTGSVAATLTPKLVKEILEQVPDVELKVIATERSQFFFRFEDLLVSTVMTDKDEWPHGELYIKGSEVIHIDLGLWADALLIAPLSADTLSDMAHGKANKFLTSLVLAWPREKEIILAPAMNTRMWDNPITQENLAKVQRVYRARVVPPVAKMLACKTVGMGAMAEIDSIIGALLGLPLIA